MCVCVCARVGFGWEEVIPPEGVPQLSLIVRLPRSLHLSGKNCSCALVSCNPQPSVKATRLRQVHVLEPQDLSLSADHSLNSFQLRKRDAARVRAIRVCWLLCSAESRGFKASGKERALFAESG